ncbi:MAG: recombinase family protein [Parvibaculaceae bacterium]
MTRAVIYARYSSDNQRDASIEDQVRLCRARAEREGWQVVEVYGDRAVSGTSLLRPGYQAVMEDARTGRIDVILAESLDRLSRDQEETAALFKRLQFFGVELITVAEGPITELHVGLKGTMNALYLKDLAQKTRRGLEGRVREGRSGGGLCYGYEIVDERDVRGEPVRGGRRILPAEAAIVQRIFTEFAGGTSPRSIALRLNNEKVPGPAGGTWGPSTIYGNWRRGTGILNNELYIGRLIWNRMRYVKDPATGKRVSQPNPPDTLVTTDVPELRIIEQDLWDRVKERQSAARAVVLSDPSAVPRPERARRPAYLLSGLLSCGVCGGGFSKISRDHYGCSRARNKGTCTNRLTIRRDAVEQRVVEGLQRQLMQPAEVKFFVERFNAEANREWAARATRRQGLEKELRQVQKQLDVAVDAILEGLRTPEIRERLSTLEQRKAELRSVLAVPEEPMPALHPGIAQVYERKVATLAEALQVPAEQPEASAALRELIDTIRLVPDTGALRIELHGELGALLRLCDDGKSKHPRGGTEGVSVTLVAGVGFEPTTFRL